MDTRGEVSPVAVGPVQGPEALSRKRSTATGESSQRCRAACGAPAFAARSSGVGEGCFNSCEHVHVVEGVGMAPRKSATKTEARERARRAAAEAMAREQRLLEFGEEFFLAQGEAEQILESAERRIAEIRARAEQDAAQAKSAQARVVAGMRDERVPVAEIAQRLELTVGEVRALLKDATAQGLAKRSEDRGSGGIDESVAAAPREPVGV